MPQPDGKTGSILTLLTPCVPGFFQSLPQRAQATSASISKTEKGEMVTEQHPAFKQLPPFPTKTVFLLTPRITFSIFPRASNSSNS